MRCPRCADPDTRVIDSRDLENGTSIRRRRECPVCGHRFTTYERPESLRLAVIKRDGRREEFDRAKLQHGLMRALQKRPVTLERIEQAVEEIEASVRGRGTNEVTSRQVGTVVMEKLREIDELAYIRFASVYHSYEDIGTLKREVDRLMEREPSPDR